MSKEIKINKDMAEKEFQRWCDAMDIETDANFLEEREQNMFSKNKRTVVKSIMLGSSIIDDEDLLVFTSTRKDPNKSYTFYECTGHLLVSIEKTEGSNARMFAALGELTRTSQGDFSSMLGSDLNMVISTYMLLMA